MKARPQPEKECWQAMRYAGLLPPRSEDSGKLDWSSDLFSYVETSRPGGVKGRVAHTKHKKDVPGVKGRAQARSPAPKKVLHTQRQSRRKGQAASSTSSTPCHGAAMGASDVSSAALASSCEMTCQFCEQLFKSKMARNGHMRGCKIRKRKLNLKQREQDLGKPGSAKKRRVAPSPALCPFPTSSTIDQERDAAQLLLSLSSPPSSFATLWTPPAPRKDVHLATAVPWKAELYRFDKVFSLICESTAGEIDR